MKKQKKRQKLYCYVDESGQDTEAGFVRDAQAGDKRLKPLYAEALRKGIIRKV